ncbi:MAG: polymer-forming cytoskeletal protein, partial [Anaerolineales bacterium]
ETLGNLDVVGGDVLLMAGSRVEQVYLYGGNLIINGEVQADIHALGGQLTLGDTARVGGDISLIGGSLERAPGAQVEGQVSSGIASPFSLRLPRLDNAFWPNLGFRVNQGFDNLGWLGLQSVGLTALAMLVVLFAPKATERAGDAALSRPWEAGGLGLIVAIVTPPLLVGFALTIIGIPVVMVLALLAAVLLTFGWIAMGLEVGKRLAHALNVNWSLLADAALGTLLLTLVANSIGLTPCVGWVVPTVIGFVGMGGVILAIFGNRAYPAPAAPLVGQH